MLESSECLKIFVQFFQNLGTFHSAMKYSELFGIMSWKVDYTKVPKKFPINILKHFRMFQMYETFQKYLETVQIIPKHLDLFGINSKVFWEIVYTINFIPEHFRLYNICCYNLPNVWKHLFRFFKILEHFIMFRNIQICLESCSEELITRKLHNKCSDTL